MPIDYSAPRRGKGKSKLAALRIAAGLTQEELARLSGVSVFVVKEIEAGRTNRRTLESLVRIAAAIGVTPLDIIKEDDAADGPTPEDLAKAATVPGVSWSASKMERAQTTIRLPTELKEQLQKEADRRGDSFNETVIRLLLRGLESQSSRADPHTE